MRNKKGFTLIELLVAIAIIALLASILLPVFAQARNKARQATCESNLKQFGVAFTMYAQDYDGFFPNPGGRSITGVTNYAAWTSATDPQALQYNAGYVNATPGGPRMGQGTVDLWNPGISGSVYP